MQRIVNAEPTYPPSAFVEPGLGSVVAMGGTSIKYALIEGGTLSCHEQEATPSDSEAIFRWMARRILNAREAGAEWVVLGFACPVTQLENGTTIVGPVGTKGGALSDGSWNVKKQLAAAEPAVEEALRQDGFRVAYANDCALLSYGAADRFAAPEETKVMAITNGTGIGSGMVRRSRASKPWRPVPDQMEIGAIAPVLWGKGFSAVRDRLVETGVIKPPPGLRVNERTGQALVTHEQIASGSAIEAICGVKAEHLPSEHPYWETVSEAMALLIFNSTVLYAPDLVVVNGGVGSGRAETYAPYVQHLLEQVYLGGREFREGYRSNIYLPRIVYTPQEDAAWLEPSGAMGLMRAVMNPA